MVVLERIARAGIISHGFRRKGLAKLTCGTKRGTMTFRSVEYMEEK